MRFLTTIRAAAFLLVAVQLAYPVAAQNNKLAPPTGLWAAQTDANTITLVWQGAQGAVQYQLFGPKSNKGGAGSEIQQLATLGRNAARYVAPIIGPGLLHQFSLRAVAAKGLASDQVKFNPVVPVAKQATPGTVSPPSSVTAKDVGSGKIRIDWSAVPGATGYSLGRSVAPGGFKTLCPLCPTKASYVDTGVSSGARHIYTVAAIAPSGTSRTTRSNEVMPTGGKTTPIAGGDPSPKGLSDLKATVVSPTSVRLTWLPGIGAASFLIRRNAGGMQQLIATVAGGVSSFIDHVQAGALAGLISYEVEAVDAKGSSTKATVAIAPDKAPADSVVSPLSPKGLSNLKATVVSPTSVRLTWDPGKGNSSFRIKRRVGEILQPVATLDGTISTFLDLFPRGSLAGGLGYEVEAVDAKGGVQKATVAIAPEKAATDSALSSPKGLSDLKATVVSPTSVRLTWDPGKGNSSFRIKRRVGEILQPVATLDGTISTFLDLFPRGSLAGGLGYEVEAVDAKGGVQKATVAIPPEKAAADRVPEAAPPDPGAPEEIEIESLPRPRPRGK